MIVHSTMNYCGASRCHLRLMKALMSPIVLALASFAAHAQTPVEKDPFHKIVFENDKVRVLDLQVSGRDTTTMHIHRSASVVVFVTKSQLAIQAPGEEPVVTSVDPGSTVYRAYDEKPATHKVWSNDGSLMRCIVIEIK
jgi:hypothetical protein